MTVIDPSTAIGKVRLRVGDFLDLSIFPDAVYQSTLDDNEQNVVRTAKMMAQYILAALTMRVHEKLAQVEVYGNQYVENYVLFLKTTILNPNLMEVAPVPYAGSGLLTVHPLEEFRKDWNANYGPGTASDQMKLSALGPGINGLF